MRGPIATLPVLRIVDQICQRGDGEDQMAYTLYIDDISR
jgi:hypothetical protein